MNEPPKLQTVLRGLMYALLVGLLVYMIWRFFTVDDYRNVMQAIWISLAFLSCFLLARGGAEWAKPKLIYASKVVVSFIRRVIGELWLIVRKIFKLIATIKPKHAFSIILLVLTIGIIVVLAYLASYNEQQQTLTQYTPTSEMPAAETKPPTFDLPSQEPSTTLPPEESEYCETELDESYSYADEVYEYEYSSCVYYTHEDECQNYANITLQSEPTLPHIETTEPITPTLPPPVPPYPTPNPILPPDFIPVTHILGIPPKAFIGTGLALHGEAYPHDANNRFVYWRTWEIVSGIGASLDHNVLITTIPGDIIIRATIANGAAPSTDFVQYFTISVVLDERIFYAGDIDVINAIITNNSLLATFVDNSSPVTTLPNDWDFITWSDSSPRRVIHMFLSGSSFSTGERDRNISGHFYVSRLAQLSWLIVQTNQMTSINISSNYDLEVLHVQDAQLTSLDVSNNSRLRELFVGGNQLTQLNLLNNPALSWLDARRNRLSYIDISNNPNLVTLTIYRNQLTMLDISNNPRLERLTIFENNIISSDDIIGWRNNFDHAGVFVIGVSDYPFTFYPQW